MRKKKHLTDFAMFSNPINHCQHRQRFMIYEDNTKKMYWDIYVGCILLFIVNIMPYHIAFNYESKMWCITYNLIDFCFFIDLVLMFFTTLPATERTQQIDNRRKIIINYLTGWFIIDLSSILPFDSLLTSYRTKKLILCNSSSNANVLLRAPKITKVLRGLRLLRLIKVFKILKNQK